MSFHELCDLAVKIHSGESDMPMDDFETKIQESYDSGELTGSEYDWLMFGLEAFE